MGDGSALPQDAQSVVRNPGFRRLLILSAVVGLIVSVGAWAFLTLVPWTQDRLFVDLPEVLGFSGAPWWWPIPVLIVAGTLTALAIVRMPGGGGGIPADGFSAGLTEPSVLPGVLLAALATLGFGLVLGPSSPVIALGMGLGLFLVRRVGKDAPDNVQQVVAVAGGFAALAMVFSNPIVAAIVVIEAAGIGGAMAPLIVLPGLVAAGIGSLVYLGMGELTGLSTAAYALSPVRLESLDTLSLSEVAWAIPLAVVCGALGVAVVTLGQRTQRLVTRNQFIWLPIIGVVVALLAILFAQITGQSELAILFSGSRALDPLLTQADTLAVATVAWLMLFKAGAWMLSMGSFRGGPVFPAIFVGVIAGLLASNLPGLSMSAAVPITVAATVVAVLRLPLSAAVIAMVMTGSAGLTAIPLIIVGMAAAYVVGEAIRGMVAKPASATGAAAAGP